MVSRNVVLFVVALLLPMAVAAQDVRVQASVSSNVIGPDERLVYSLTVEGASMGDIERPGTPRTTNLAPLQSMPSTQRSTTIVNGRMRQSVGFRWTFRPVRPGTARVEAVAVVIDGETYRTEPITVEVVSQQRAQQSRPSTNRSRTRSPDGDDEPGLSEDELFIRAIPSQEVAYENEQVTVTYRLYFREGVQLRQSRLADSWDAEGFWREDLEVEGRPLPSTELVDGVRYRTIVLKRAAVFPTRTGELTVDPLRIETEAYLPRRSRDPFESLFGFGGNFENVEVASPPVDVDVRALPDGAPEAFQGAVGTYDLDVRVDASQVEVGEAVEVAVEIRGAGNLATLQSPELEAPNAFEVYDPEVQTSINRSGRRIQGTKTFTYTLVPGAGGTFELPPVRFAFFDAEADSYRVETSDPFTIEVTGTASEPAAASLTGGGLPVDDIAPPLEEARRWRRTDATPLHRSPWAYAALVLPWLAILGVWGWRRRADHLEANPALVRRRRAHPEARRRLAEAEALLAGDRRAFYQAVEGAVLGFVGDRLDVAPQGLTRDQLGAVLREGGADEDERRRLGDLLDQCDRGRFAPAAGARADRERALARAHSLIADLDEAFRPAAHA